ncbi:hypothetical protein KR018_003828, partial [Drosophila ironensis]
CKLKMYYISVPEEEEKCTEAQLDILLKINSGQYRLVKKNKRSSVWNVYREIVRSDGTKLKWRYFCLGCKRVMQSTGGTTSNLRIHKCHVRYLKANGPHGNQSPAPAAVQMPRKRNSRQEDLFEILDETTTHCPSPEVRLQEEHIPAKQAARKPRPLLKLFSDEEPQTDPEEHLELDQEPEPEPEQEMEMEAELDPEPEPEPAIEIDHHEIQVPPDTLAQSSSRRSHSRIALDASDLAEAESYANAWAHAFLRLTEEQKLFAKRSIDELLVLGRLEKLSISTVTTLTEH